MLKNLVWKFGIPLLLALGAATVLAVPFVERILTEWFRADVEQRSALVMSTIDEGLTPLLAQHSAPRIKRFLAKVTSDERLIAILICGRNGEVLYRTEGPPREARCLPSPVPGASFEIVRSTRGLIHVARFPLAQPTSDAADVVIVHDLSFVDRRQSRLRDYMVAFMALSALAAGALAVIVAWLILRGWVAALVRDIRGRRFPARELTPGQPGDIVLAQVRQTVRELEHAQLLEAEFREVWSPRALQHVVRDHLEAELIVVSNREPYIHKRDGEHISIEYPASGMVTALEPVMRACSGTWIAHGSGNADRDVVDSRDHIPVPPGDPSYTLRRVWMSEEEEAGYYYGFSNEGLWPLCHMAYVRPAFRGSDWGHYAAMNARFADAVKQEARSRSPVVLIQDYHFALLPALVRERLPEATIVLFWHIPWPNAETFGICPWKRELLLGMLQADIIGFHTRYYCRNFLAAADRALESHIDPELYTITVQGHVAHVKSYPISIEWPPHWLERLPPAAECRRRVFEELKLPPDTRLGVGVERWDFTKGIPERMAALERLLENEPHWRGKLVFLQVAAPSRSKLPAYQELQRTTLAAVERINQRFGDDAWRPIILVPEHRNPDQVFPLYRAADFCVVNSLHDGMNLVAKEFVASRDDEDGVLVLSTFTGASRELVEALTVNPFDVDATAGAIHQALNMSRTERQERMRAMRQTIKENDVFRWAGRMLVDATRIRQWQKLNLQSR